MTRRHFLSTTAAAPALLHSQSPNNVIRVGIIGVGNRGSFLLRQVLKVPNVKVVAICDLDPDALKRAGQLAAAHSPDLMTEFRKLLELHPDYTAGYFMAAQTLARAERTDDARKMLQDGIASAVRTGNQHAQSEMEAMLAELG